LSKTIGGWIKILVYTGMVFLNLNGGPSKKARELSSLAVTRRKGRTGRKSQELRDLLCPMTSPTEAPVSALNTAPNLRKSKVRTAVTEKYSQNLLFTTLPHNADSLTVAGP
jgi:hypothetical protein